jgi:hypothetical protein
MGADYIPVAMKPSNRFCSTYLETEAVCAETTSICQKKLVFESTGDEATNCRLISPSEKGGALRRPLVKLIAAPATDRDYGFGSQPLHQSGSGAASDTTILIDGYDLSDRFAVRGHDIAVPLPHRTKELGELAVCIRSGNSLFHGLSTM